MSWSQAPSTLLTTQMAKSHAALPHASDTIDNSHTIHQLLETMREMHRTLQDQGMHNKLLQYDVAWLHSMPKPQGAPQLVIKNPPLMTNIHLLVRRFRNRHISLMPV